jgi:4a-hydroxytetrahydrobiopterin dehydratase
MKDPPSYLLNKRCIPCEGGLPPLNNSEVQRLLIELKGGWNINQAGHLYKCYKFKNFLESMTFANIVAAVAEKEAHHPDLTISWRMCSVEIWTHKINGLTESDFILAAKIEALR